MKSIEKVKKLIFYQRHLAVRTEVGQNIFVATHQGVVKSIVILLDRFVLPRMVEMSSY